MCDWVERDNDGIRIGFWVNSVLGGDMALDFPPPVILDRNRGFDEITTLVCCQLHSSRHAIPGTNLITNSPDDPRERIGNHTIAVDATCMDAVVAAVKGAKGGLDEG